MNKLYLVGGLLIAISIFIFSSMKDDISTYSNFDSASASNSVVKVVGTLDKSKDLEYDPENKPNEFKFYLLDDKGISKQVVLSKPKPMEFENAEKIVLTGKMKGEQFMASEMLTKCPSKYKNEELQIKS